MNTESGSWLGACPCGALGVRYTTALPPELWLPRRCLCDFCTAHGAVYVSDPEGRIAFAALDDDAFARVRFAYATAEFLVCRRCSGFVGAQLVARYGEVGIANAARLRLHERPLRDAVRVDFGDEAKAQRIARRTATWTPLEARL